MLLGTLPVSYTHAQGPPVISVRSEGTVSLQVVNVPLNEVLRILAKNVPMEIRGSVSSQELVTLDISNLALEQAVRRIMRGYNYVLVRPDASAKPILTVLSVAQRTPDVPPPQAAGAPPVPAAATPPAPVPAAQPAPGTIPPRQRGPVLPGRGQPGVQQAQELPPTAAARPEAAQTQQPQMGPPGTAPMPGAVPPAIPGSPAATGVFPPAIAGTPPSAAPGTSPPAPGQPGLAGQPQQAGLPQQPVQPPPEPIRIMTPFGERIVEPETSQAPTGQPPQGGGRPLLPAGSPGVTTQPFAPPSN